MFQANHSKNNGPKRAAFGDVSNTANLVRANRDDSAAVKNPNKVSEKRPLLAPERKPAALPQPAQRPMPTSSLKGVLNSVTNPKPAEVSAGSRKTFHIRDNAVYRDYLQPLAETKGSASKEVATEVAHDNKVANISRPSTAPLQRDNLEEAVSKDDLKDFYSPAEEYSDGIDVKERESKGYENDCKVNGDYDLHQRHTTAPGVHGSSGATKYPCDSLALSHSTYDHVQAHSEPEEYWDEDDYENEEDEGYTTARSYRSRGDNTTGGATTVLFPKYNSQVHRELALAKQIVEATRTVEDIEDEYWDTSMVAEYNDEIFEYIRDQEIKMLPNAHYMDNQAEIQWSMRSVLMDWLVQVHSRFFLLPETLFLCVNYIDRFLSCKIVSLGKLQLVGATAIFIAAKYEEINCPSVQEIVYMVDGGYTADEILKAERFMLTLLQFELGWPGPMSFLRRISKADDYDLETRTLAKYFLEITIMDERFVGIPPSFAAAGAHCLARLFLGRGNWTPAHVHYAGYTYAQLYPLISLILECCENPRKHHASVFEKYADRRFKCASGFVEKEVRRGYRVPESKESAVLDRNGHFDSGCLWKRT
ncbi:g2 mitotic-specific [Aspergillus sp. HF37]|nr:g2 mitotic-specific [Aspergillus sp. HF37]